MEKENFHTLFDLKVGAVAEIKDIQTESAQAAKLAAMGLAKGQHVTRKAGRNPLVISVCGSEMAIGPKIAKQIIVGPCAHAKDSSFRPNTFLMAGNPNVGKSLLFSRLTGIGILSSNFPGTTVGLNYGTTVFNGENYNIIDIPGLYRLEEKWLIEGKKRDLFKELKYDFIVCVADASHLERNLYFTLELMSLGKPVILLLNKFDEALRKGISIDVRGLSKQLGIPVIAAVATTGEGLRRLEVTVDKLVKNDGKQGPVAVPRRPRAENQTQTRLVYRKTAGLGHQSGQRFVYCPGRTAGVFISYCDAGRTDYRPVGAAV